MSIRDHINAVARAENDVVKGRERVNASVQQLQKRATSWLRPPRILFGGLLAGFALQRLVAGKAAPKNDESPASGSDTTERSAGSNGKSPIDHLEHAMNLVNSLAPLALNLFDLHQRWKASTSPVAGDHPPRTSSKAADYPVSDADGFGVDLPE